MNRILRSKSLLATAGFGLLAALVVAGCPGGVQGPPGPEGPQGPAGPQGPPGPTASAVLPETVVNITGVNGGEAVQAGGTFTATFTIEDADGQTILLDDLNRLNLYVSGPSTNYNRVIEPDSDLANFAQAEDGTYTYTAPSGFPTVYLAPENDSDFYGPEDGELTGQPIQDGTYTVAVEARRVFTVDGEEIRKADDAVFDFVVGSATLSPRQFVTQEACNACHVNLQAHGSNRYDVKGCLLCHTVGSEDLITEDPDKQTPGVTIHMGTLIHKLHYGKEIPEVAATANSADPYLYEVIGFRESVHDYSDVIFPFMPGGTGFNETMRNCDACHGGAAQEQEIYADANVVQKQCLTCHSDMDFTAGTVLDPSLGDVADGLLTKDQLDDPAFRTNPGGVNHALTDGSCLFCHSAGQSWEVEGIHFPPLRDPDIIAGLEVQITNITGGSGDGFFNPGDTPVVEFNIVDANGDPFPIDDLTVNLQIAGPVGNYQRLLPPDGAMTTTVTVKGNGGVPATGTGPFTYTSVDALPATYPAPYYDSDDYTYDTGWGELKGEALLDGSYTVLIYAYQEIDVGGTSYRESSLPGTAEFRIGSAGDTPGYIALVTDEKCNACHGDLRFHGNTRRGVENCAVCHVAGMEDRPTALAGQTQAPEPDSMDWNVLIHQVHAAQILSVVQDGGVYDIVGFQFGVFNEGNVEDFSNGIHPAMPLGPADCGSCHATDAWNTPLERNDINIWKVACTSCHDSVGTMVHVELNTLGVGQEACDVCHAEGAAFSVVDAHAAP
jgi:OmcA/MtrC family decaheme c-type cytochrome